MLMLTTGTKEEELINLSVVGEFESPDRLNCRSTIKIGNLTITRDRLVVIGSQAWFDSGEGWNSTTASNPEVVDTLELCAGSSSMWENFNLSDLQGISGQPETVNGVAATRIDLVELLESPFASGFTPNGWEVEDIESFAIWLEQEGRWPFAIVLRLKGDSAQFEMGSVELEEGQELVLELRLDLTDFDAPGIRVSPPVP